MSWNVCPWSTLISNTPPSKPRLGSSAEASRLKLCRNVNCWPIASKTVRPGKSSSLSLTTPGSSMNAAFGNVSAGGLGTPELDVTHIGGGPCTSVATQPGGNVGGITLSKLSPNSTGFQHGGHCGGLEATASAEISDRPEPSSLEESNPLTRWVIAREELITPAPSAATAVTKIANVAGRLIASLILARQRAQLRAKLEARDNFRKKLYVI